MPKHPPEDLAWMIAEAERRRAQARAQLAEAAAHAQREQDPAYWRGRVAGLEHELAEARAREHRSTTALASEAALVSQLRTQLTTRGTRPAAASSTASPGSCPTCARLQRRIAELEALWDDEC